MPHPTRQQKTNYAFGNQFQELEKILELAVKMTMLCLTEVACCEGGCDCGVLATPW
jgi:hypothetical protein